MRRFLLGMLAGVVVGGGAVWLGLERPWGGSGSGSAPEEARDAGVAAASTGKDKGKRRGGRRRTAAAAEDGPVELSAADLALAWKGDAVELPPRSVDLGAEGDARPLTPAEINAVIRSQSQGVSDCLTEAAGNAEIKAQITLKMLVDGGGRVKKVRARAPAYLFAHGFYACVRGAALDLSFPASGAATVVTAPYDLY